MSLQPYFYFLIAFPLNSHHCENYIEFWQVLHKCFPFSIHTCSQIASSSSLMVFSIHTSARTASDSGQADEDTEQVLNSHSCTNCIFRFFLLVSHLAISQFTPVCKLHPCHATVRFWSIDSQFTLVCKLHKCSGSEVMTSSSFSIHISA